MFGAKMAGEAFLPGELGAVRSRRSRASVRSLALLTAGGIGLAALSAAPAHAYWRGGVWIGAEPVAPYYPPPPVYVPPPVVYAPPPVIYPPPYPPAFPGAYRAWVPGHWAPWGWVPGHWR